MLVMQLVQQLPGGPFCQGAKAAPSILTVPGVVKHHRVDDMTRLGLTLLGFFSNSPKPEQILCKWVLLPIFWNNTIKSHEMAWIRRSSTSKVPTSLSQLQKCHLTCLSNSSTATFSAWSKLHLGAGWSSNKFVPDLVLSENPCSMFHRQNCFLEIVQWYISGTFGQSHFYWLAHVRHMMSYFTHLSHLTSLLHPYPGASHWSNPGPRVTGLAACPATEACHPALATKCWQNAVVRCG